jgi:hypothetical protein
MEWADKLQSDYEARNSPRPFVGAWHTGSCSSCGGVNVRLQERGEHSVAFGDKDSFIACEPCWENIRKENECPKCQGDLYDPNTHTFGGWDHNNDEPITVCIKKEGILQAFIPVGR